MHPGELLKKENQTRSIIIFQKKDRLDKIGGGGVLCLYFYYLFNKYKKKIHLKKWSYLPHPIPPRLSHVPYVTNKENYIGIYIDITITLI